MLMQIDLLGLDQKDLEWYQMGVRAIIVFIVAIIFIRIAGIRTFGTKTPFDVVLSITLGALLSRCITGHYPFFNCLFAAAVLASFHRLVAWLSFRSKIINTLTEGEAILLFKDGKKLQRKLSQQCITENDLVKSLHEQNIDDYKNVKTIWLEPDGKISIIKKEKNEV